MSATFRDVEFGCLPGEHSNGCQYMSTNIISTLIDIHADCFLQDVCSIECSSGTKQGASRPAETPRVGVAEKALFLLQRGS